MKLATHARIDRNKRRGSEFRSGTQKVALDHRFSIDRNLTARSRAMARRYDALCERWHAPALERDAQSGTARSGRLE